MDTNRSHQITHHTITYCIISSSDGCSQLFRWYLTLGGLVSWASKCVYLNTVRQKLSPHHRDSGQILILHKHFHQTNIHINQPILLLLKLIATKGQLSPILMFFHFSTLEGRSSWFNFAKHLSPTLVHHLWSTALKCFRSIARGTSISSIFKATFCRDGGTSPSNFCICAFGTCRPL